MGDRLTRLLDREMRTLFFPPDPSPRGRMAGGFREAPEGRGLRGYRHEVRTRLASRDAYAPSHRETGQNPEKLFQDVVEGVGCAFVFGKNA